MKYIHIKKNEFIFTSIILILWYTSILISIFYYNHYPINKSLLYNYFPFLLLILSFVIIKNYSISKSQIIKIAISLSLILSVFIILGLFFNNFFLLQFYISPSQSLGAERLGTIIAPFDNPNSNGLLLSITIAFDMFILKNFKLKKTKKLILLFSVIVLIIGLLGTFARTATMALILYLLITNYKNKGMIAILLLLITYVLFNIDMFERYLDYYGTIFTFYEDYSFNQRFEYFDKVLLILKEYPLYIFFGFAGYKGYLLQEYGSTIIDSSLVYLLVGHGLFIIVLILIYFVHLLFYHKELLLFFIMLVVTAITYPYLTEPRSTLYIGFILGLISNLVNHLKESRIEKNS